jgi:hypothetical protein
VRQGLPVLVLPFLVSPCSGVCLLTSLLCAGTLDESDSGEQEVFVHSKKKAALLPHVAAYADSHLVQLPPQQTNHLSYKEYSSCG